MSTRQLSYNLLPAHRFATKNFRGTFITLSLVEMVVSIGSTATCLILSICILTRRPFLFLMHHHTTFHPYIQATVFLIAGIAHFFKFVFLLAVTTTVLYCDGEIFLANAQVEADATTRMENDQSANSPNGIARKCFHKRQRAIKWLRKVLGIYPALQLLCGIITLIFWWKGGATMKGGAGGGEEGAGSSSLDTPYHQEIIQNASKPSKVLFSLYLACWTLDLLLTPLLLLVAIWHYARVDWQVQLLSAQGKAEDGGGEAGGSSANYTASVTSYKAFDQAGGKRHIRQTGRKTSRRRPRRRRQRLNRASPSPAHSLEEITRRRLTPLASSIKRLPSSSSSRNSSSDKFASETVEGEVRKRDTFTGGDGKRSMFRKNVFAHKEDPVSVPVSPSTYSNSPSSIFSDCPPSPLSPPTLSQREPPLQQPSRSRSSTFSSSLSSSTSTNNTVVDFIVASAHKAKVTMVKMDGGKKLDLADQFASEKPLSKGNRLSLRRVKSCSIQSISLDDDDDNEGVCDHHREGGGGGGGCPYTSPAATTTKSWRSSDDDDNEEDGFDCFRICIHTDEIDQSPTGGFLR